MRRLTKNIILAKPIVESYGGKYLVRGEYYCVREWTWTPTRLVVVRFPSREAANNFWVLMIRPVSYSKQIRQNYDEYRWWALILCFNLHLNFERNWLALLVQFENFWKYRQWKSRLYGCCHCIAIQFSVPCDFDADVVLRCNCGCDTIKDEVTLKSYVSMIVASTNLAIKVLRRAHEWWYWANTCRKIADYKLNAALNAPAHISLRHSWLFFLQRKICTMPLKIQINIAAVFG